MFDVQRPGVSPSRTTDTPTQLRAASPTRVDTETEHVPGDAPTRAHSPEHDKIKGGKPENALRGDSCLPRDVRSDLTAKLLVRFYVKPHGGGHRWQLRSIENNPLLKKALCDKYQADFLTSPDMVKRCERVTFERGMNSDECLNLYLSRTSGEIKECRFYRSGSSDSYACDVCVDQRKLCIRLAWGQGHERHDTVIYPLPTPLRKNKTWTDPHFWVRE